MGILGLKITRNLLVCLKYFFQLWKTEICDWEEKFISFYIPVRWNFSINLLQVLSWLFFPFFFFTFCRFFCHSWAQHVIGPHHQSFVTVGFSLMILPKFFLSYWDQNHSMTPDILTESCTPCQSMSLGKSIFLMCVIWSLKSCCLSSVPSGLEGCHSSKPITVDSSPLACITMGAAFGSI